MLSKSNADAHHASSFLASVALLFDDVCVTSPPFQTVVNLFTTTENAWDEVYDESSFEADHLIEAMVTKNSCIPALTLQEDLDLFVKDDYLATLLNTNRDTQAPHQKGEQCDVRSTAFMLTNLSSSEEKDYCAHMREMSVLLAILQRPPAAFVSRGFPLLYRKLMQRFKADNLASILVARIGTLEKAFQRDLESSTITLLTSLFSMYVDALFYFCFHLSESEIESFINGDLLARLLDIVVSLGEARYATSFQRSSLVLLSIVIKHIPRVHLDTLQGLVKNLLLERAGRTNIIDFVVLAAVPYHSLRDTGLVVEQWLQQALQVLCQCTTYDFNLDVLFLREGPYGRQLSFVIKRILGSTYEKFWSRVSASWWNFCTIPALMSAAKSCFIYAFTWSSIPPGILSLLEFVNSNLTNCACTPTTGSPESRKNGALVSTTSNQNIGKDVNSFETFYLLLPSVCLGGMEQSRKINFAHDDEAVVWMHNSFNRIEARCIFFLSLYSYILAAFLFHCDRFNEADEFFFLRMMPRQLVPTEETDAATLPSDGTNTLRQPVLPLPFPTHFIWKADKLNVFSICMEFLALKATSASFLSSPWGKVEEEFYAAAISLLYSALSLFPQENDVVNFTANRNLLHLFEELLLYHLKLNDSFPMKPQVTISRVLFSLLHLYLNAVQNLPSVANKLLTKRVAIGFDKGGTTTLNLTLLHLSAYVNLCQEGRNKMVSPNRLLHFLADFDTGVVSRSLGAMQFFASLMVRLAQVVETVGLRTQLMLEETTPHKSKFMMEQLFEGTAALIGAYQKGSISLCGYSTFRLIEISLTLILEIMRVCKSFSPVATSLLQSMEGCNGRNRVPFSFILLSCLTTPTSNVFLPAAQLLGGVLEQGYTLFPALSSNLTCCTRHSLLTSLHSTLQAYIGSPGNVVRLKILSMLAERDLPTFQFLTDPDRLTSSSEAIRSSDLAITKVLSGIILDEGALPSEKASTLELMITIGLTDTLPLNCVASLLSEETPNIKITSHIFEHVALSAAAIHFMNRVIAMQMCKDAKTRQALRGPRSTHRLDLSSSLEDCTKPSSANTNTTTASVVPAKVEMRKCLDTIDLVLRHSCTLLTRAARNYENLCGQAHHVSKSSSQECLTALSAARPEAILPITMLSWATANGLKAVHPDLTMSQLGLRRKQLWDHHSPSSWVEISRLGAGFPTAGGCPRPRKKSFHTLALSNSIEVEEAAYKLVCPLILGEAYCFAGSDDDVRLNVMASTMETIRRLAVVLQTTLWLSVAGEQNARALFLQRYFETLRNAIHWVTYYKPTFPLLARSLWECTRQCLQLSNVASCVLEYSCVNTDQRLEIDASTRRSMHHLLEFMRVNKKNLSLLNPCLNVISTLGRENNIGVESQEGVFFILADALFQEEKEGNVTITPEHLTFLEGCIKIFEYLPLNSCPLLVLAPLLRCIFQRAIAASCSILANATEDIHTSFFVLVMRLIRSALSRTPSMRTLSLLPLEQIMTMMGALSNFSATFILESPHTYRRQSWHIVWSSLLELFATAISTCSNANESVDQPFLREPVAERGSLALINTRLVHFTRFLLVIGGFAQVGKAEHAAMPLFLWDLEELELCTRLAAQLSVLMHPMTTLLPLIQRCFLRIYRYRLHEFRTTSSEDPRVAQSEKDAAQQVLVRTVQSQLIFFIAQPFHSVPFLINEKGEACIVVGTSSSQNVKSSGFFSTLTGNAVDGNAPAQKPIITFEVLWRFISQEFHIIRHPKSALKGCSLEATPSLESSLTRSPSCGHEVEKSIEEDAAIPDVLTEIQAEKRSLHLDNIQLALTLYTLAVEELNQGLEKVAFSDNISLSHKREVRMCTEKLLHLLSNIADEMRYRSSAHLLKLLDSIPERLNRALVKL